MKNKKTYIIIILSILFIINTILVINNSYINIDDNIHNLVMHLNFEIITKVMKFFTFLGSTLFIVVLQAVIFFSLLFNKKVLNNKNMAFSSLIILVVSTVINNVIKLLIRRPRPVYMLVNENTFSYPSGHTMASMTTYGFLIYLIIKSPAIPKFYKILYSIILIMIVFNVGVWELIFSQMYSEVF